ncbi:MAG: hypothetical protein ACE5QF_09415 [Thermoplasmata archaeon]
MHSLTIALRRKGWAVSGDAFNSRSRYRNQKKERKEITKAELAAFVVGLVMPLFAIPFQGRFPLRRLVEAVVFACVEAISIEASSRRRKAPPGWRLRHHLRKLCLEEVERRANEILRKMVQVLLSSKARLDLAVDWSSCPITEGRSEMGRRSAAARPSPGRRTSTPTRRCMPW